jgi:hypothetical protein
MVLEAPFGPVVEAQKIPVTPVIVQLAVPVRAGPFVGPCKVAVKVKEEPRFAVGELAVTATVGVYWLTTVELEETVLLTALYVVSALTLKVAP